MIKVLIVDDHAIVRRGVREIAEGIPEVTLVDETGSGRQAFKMMSSCDYDILLLDISMPGESGLEILQQVKKNSRNSRVIMLSMYSDEHYVIRALKSGASGYVTKDNTPEELEEAVMTVWQGEKYLSSDIGDSLPEDIESYHEVKFSKRESQVVRMLAKGMNDKDIARNLEISEKTVQIYTSSIYRKLGTKNRTEAAIKAMKLGFV
ncbi:MAG: response regulator transcription factor [Thermodesulfovibrionia bacterium]|nr:response regulator transcription factor [Thermodesulfovibrionia bacterium]